jgi:hypothetical protein
MAPFSAWMSAVRTVELPLTRTLPPATTKTISSPSRVGSDWKLRISVESAGQCSGKEVEWRGVSPQAAWMLPLRLPLTKAVVEEVVLEDLCQLRRVREEVGQERRGQLREGVVVGREDGERVALLRCALHHRPRDAKDEQTVHVKRLYLLSHIKEDSISSHIPGGLRQGSPS